jgi:hypothetical protein
MKTRKYDLTAIFALLLIGAFFGFLLGFNLAIMLF